MKLSAVIYGVFSFSCLAQGLILPNHGSTTVTVARDIPEPAQLTKRDEEWTLVLYNAGASGGQCGGTSSSQSGGGDTCVSIPSGKFCADVKVTAGLPNIAACNFNFRYDGAGCSGTSAKSVEVGIGEDSNGVSLSDDIKFVSIGCFAEGRVNEAAE